MLEAVLVGLVVAMWVAYARTVFRRNASQRRLSAEGGPVNPERFACIVEPTTCGEDEGRGGAFAVKMRGRIVVPRDNYDTNVRVLMADVTEGTQRAQPVLCTEQQWQMEDSPTFCLVAHNGKVPRKVSVLANWTLIATVPCSYLRFSHSGARQLRFSVSVESCRDSRVVASASYVLAYDNPQEGYADAKEDLQQAEAVALQILGSVCRGGGPAAREAIVSWICEMTTEADGTSDASRRDGLVRYFDRVLNDQQAGFDFDNACREFAGLVGVLDRYSLVRIGLRAVGAGGAADRHQTDLLARMAALVQIDPDKFRAMAQKTLSLNTHSLEDMQFLLGIRQDMGAEEVRQLLNAEYQKWNCRVTHPDAEIRAQADRMLGLIAEARNRLISGPATALHA